MSGDTRELTDAEHKERHALLHGHLDELAADFIAHNPGKRLSNTTVLELVTWSHAQTQNPTPRDVEIRRIDERPCVPSDEMEPA